MVAGMSLRSTGQIGASFNKVYNLSCSDALDYVNFVEGSSRIFPIAIVFFKWYKNFTSSLCKTLKNSQMKKKTTKGTDIKKTETPKTQYKEKKKKKKNHPQN